MNHRLIQAFNQTNTMAPRLGHSAAAANGACHNFTIEWLKLMFETGATNLPAVAGQRMMRLAARAGSSNPVLQKVFTQRWQEGTNSYTSADQMMISIRGLKEKALALNYSPYNQRAIVNQVKRPRYAGFIYSFWFGGNAHTIGLYRTLEARRGLLVPANDEVNAFDPNYGEYNFQAIEFNYWFNKLKQAYGGHLSHHMLKYVSL